MIKNFDTAPKRAQAKTENSGKFENAADIQIAQNTKIRLNLNLREAKDYK
jgi:hypothetical protein